MVNYKESATLAKEFISETCKKQQIKKEQLTSKLYTCENWYNGHNFYGIKVDEISQFLANMFLNNLHLNWQQNSVTFLVVGYILQHLINSYYIYFNSSSTYGQSSPRNDITCLAWHCKNTMSGPNCRTTTANSESF